MSSAIVKEAKVSVGTEECLGDHFHLTHNTQCPLIKEALSQMMEVKCKAGHSCGAPLTCLPDVVMTADTSLTDEVFIHHRATLGFAFSKLISGTLVFSLLDCVDVHA